MYWDVVEVKPLQHLVLAVLFEDGTKGNVRFMPQHLTGVFFPLLQPDFLIELPSKMAW